MTKEGGKEEEITLGLALMFACTVESQGVVK